MSLKGDKYETAEEVRFRLESSIVLYDGKPVYIVRVNAPEGERGPDGKNEIARVYFIEVPVLGGKDREAKEVRKYLSSKNFDLTPFKMGYMNHNGQATYVARTPVRQNRQGFCSGNATFTDVRGRKSEFMGWNTMISSKGFIDMFNNKYPDFKEAGELLGDKDQASIAISRSFAFVIDNDIDALLLVNKGTKCGLSFRGDKGIRVAPKYHFLREEMEEHRIPLA